MWTIIEIKQNYDNRKELFVGGVTTLQKKPGNICLQGKLTECVQTCS